MFWNNYTRYFDAACCFARRLNPIASLPTFALSAVEQNNAAARF